MIRNAFNREYEGYKGQSFVLIITSSVEVK